MYSFQKDGFESYGLHEPYNLYQFMKEVTGRQLLTK
jgi:hypothetical protein